MRWCKERKRRGIDYNDAAMKGQIEREKKERFCFNCLKSRFVYLHYGIVDGDDKNKTVFLVKDFACIERGCYKDPSSEKDCTKCYQKQKDNSVYTLKRWNKYKIDEEACDCNYEMDAACRLPNNECYECFKKVCTQQMRYTTRTSKGLVGIKSIAIVEDTDSCYDNHCSMTYEDKICELDRPDWKLG